MWFAKRCDSPEIAGRRDITGDDGAKAYRVKHKQLGRVWPIPFGSMGDAERAAKLFNELCRIPPGTSISQGRAIVFEAMGGTYENVRRYVVERCCRW